LQCPTGGILSQSVEASSGDWLRAMPSFWAMRLFVEDGDRVAPTRSLSTSPGFVVLFGYSEAEVDRDLAKIREREKSGLMYIVRPGSENVVGATPSGSGRRNSISAARMRELEAEAEKLISPLASRACSPVLSPQQAPAMPPGIGDSLVEFTLNGDGLDDFDLDGGGGGGLGGFVGGAGGLDDFSLE